MGIPASGAGRRAHPLDNPFWSALTSGHRALALCAGDGIARYPPAYAPFLGLAHGDVDLGDAAPLVAPGEDVHLLGVPPSDVPAGWTLGAPAPLAQMICTTPLDVPDGPEVIALGEGQRADALALTALVYPHYFREQTLALGRYIGIYLDGRLAAMAGERLATEAHTELSAICTHPDFTRRGLARRLTALLANALLAEGRVPFLHVSHGNTGARRLYADMGFRLRRDIDFWTLRRAADGSAGR